MFFAKNEIIELDDQTEYFILDLAVVNNDVFYEVQTVADSNDSLTGPKMLIKAINNEGDLYIELINDPEKLKELFTS